jgi:two-component system sensor histidine kinase DesK
MVVAIAATYLPPRRRRLLIGSAVVLALLPGGVVSLVAADGELPYATLFPAALVAFTAWVTLGPLWAWDTAQRLNEARRLEAELAVKDERLRFAAELHDIQGHHLQVIALKSELAARLVEVDPVRAAAEMKEVRQLSADALSDTRAVVQGYRRTTLDDEIANASRVLAAAAIDATMALDHTAVAVDLPDAARRLLGLVMREATTNVLRHSRARHAEVDYRVTDGVARLRVSNDGADAHPAAADGTGLRTLADRLRAAGGELTWDHDGDRFVVTASLPTSPPDTTVPYDGVAR